MTQDEIIDLATEAGLAYNHDDYPDIWDTYMNVGREEIMAFAKLVAAKAIAELESQEPFEDLATELFVVAQVSPADNGFSETIERIESWLREHFTHPPQAKP